jgi:hypothetical protein
MTTIPISSSPKAFLGRAALATAGVLVLAFAISSPGTNTGGAPRRDETKLDYPERGQHGFVSLSKILGCVRLDEMQHYEQLLGDMDVPALNAFVRSRTVTGQCREIAKGTEVVVDQSPSMIDDFCVRPVGEPDCLWTNAGWIRRGQPELAASPRRPDNPG